MHLNIVGTYCTLSPTASKNGRELRALRASPKGRISRKRQRDFSTAAWHGKLGTGTAPSVRCFSLPRRAQGFCRGRSESASEAPGRCPRETFGTRHWPTVTWPLHRHPAAGGVEESVVRRRRPRGAREAFRRRLDPGASGGRSLRRAVRASVPGAALARRGSLAPGQILGGPSGPKRGTGFLSRLLSARGLPLAKPQADNRCCGANSGLAENPWLAIDNRQSTIANRHSTVTDFAKFLGLSTLQPRATAAW